VQLKPSLDLLQLDSVVIDVGSSDRPTDMPAQDVMVPLGGKEGKQMIHVRSASVNVESSTIHSGHQKIGKDIIGILSTVMCSEHTLNLNCCRRRRGRDP
jgi:hypothetical protein